MRLRTLLILVYAVTPVFAQGPDVLFLEANQLFQQGKITEARDLYERIHMEGYESPSLYFNLGNAYYKLGMIPKAILNYERALRLSPSDDDIRYNLQLANLLITDKIEATPRLFIWDYWDNAKTAFTPATWTWTGYLFFLAMVVSLSLFVFSRSYAQRRLWFISAWLAGALMVLCAVLLIATVTDLQRSDHAIITTAITTVKNAPDSKSSDAFVLHGGMKVVITDEVSEWLKIRLADGKVGWMERTAAEVI